MGSGPFFIRVSYDGEIIEIIPTDGFLSLPYDEQVKELTRGLKHFENELEAYDELGLSPQAFVKYQDGTVETSSKEKLKATVKAYKLVLEDSLARRKLMPRYSLAQDR